MNTTQETKTKKVSLVHEIFSIEQAEKHNRNIQKKEIWKQTRISKMNTKIERLKTEISKLETAIYHEEHREFDIKNIKFDLSGTHEVDDQEIIVPMDRVEKVGRLGTSQIWKINGKWHIIRGQQENKDKGTFDNILWKLREVSEKELYYEI
jgi:hypothetical protein